MTNAELYKNPVLDDKELQAGLRDINPKFSNFFTRVVGEAWDLPLIDKKTKALIAIAVDVANQDHKGCGNLFAAHVSIALQQGATSAEIEELLLFMCVYAGVNKVASCLSTLKKIFEHSGVRPMISAIKKVDYALRDQDGKVVFYVLLWKRKSITLELFDNYWRDVHGPVCARLPGQYQYWQFHVAHNQGDLWSIIEGIEYNTLPEDQFDGIAELTFETEQDRQIWFDAAAILMDDEHNLFSKAIGYNTSPGNSKTYVDRIETGDPNGKLGVLKFHVMVKKADGVSKDEFRRYMTNSFAASVVQSDSVLKFRLHLFEEIDNSRPDASGVVHYEPPEKQYQAAFEIAFSNPLEMEKFFASKEYAQAVKNQAKYVKELYAFTERSAYTFVYYGQMTLAGQRSSKVANLIAEVGATNQLKEDIAVLMNSKVFPINGKHKTGLGHYLQGVQHVGVTVQDMEKSMEFYIDVLGGKLVIAEDGLVGDKMQNTLFQKEELDASAQGVDPKSIGIPNIRDGKEVLDVKFISFGSTCVELIYFKDKSKPNVSTSSSQSTPLHIGNLNAMHISFQVKEDVDLNVFAKSLEEECQKRGLTNVVFNRVIRVKSEEERRKVALKYNSSKFWHESDLLADDQPEENFGEFEGWALFYCKGPNGEQLEFNQVTRKIKEHFTKAQEEYHMANNKVLAISNSQVTSRNSRKEEAIPERLYATFSTPVNTSLETAWNVLLDQIENPGYYNPEVLDYKILERRGNQVLREMKALNITVKERITWNEKTREIRHTLVNNPLFVGEAVNAIVFSASNNPNHLPIITYTFDWEAYNEEGRNFAQEIQQRLDKAVQQTVLYSKTIAEQQDTNKKLQFSKTTNSKKPMQERLPGTATDMVKRLFSRGEAFDSEGFITFFTDTPVYQFGNFEVCLDKEAIKKSAQSFFSRISAVYHDIKMMWEVGDVVFVEMDVIYWRKDDSVISLPCTDIFRLEGDKFSELRIFMDVNPVFDPTIEVPASASVMTVSEGNRLTPPDIMRKHFAEYPEAKRRIATGYTPKWSIDGPQWSIEGEEISIDQEEGLTQTNGTANKQLSSIRLKK